MPSSTQPSSQSSSKKQQQISSFFNKKPLSGNGSGLVVRPQPKVTPVHDLDEQPEDESLFFSDEDVQTEKSRSTSTKRRPDEEADQLLSSRKKVRLSDDADKSPVQLGYNAPELESPNRPLTPVAANGLTGKPKVSDRTAKYLFSSSPLRDEESALSDPESHRQRDRLHQQFVKKLGRPDSIADIRRRNGHIEANQEEDAEADDNNEEEAAEPEPKAPKGKKGAAKKRASKLTPMEKQVLEIKKMHPDTLLVVEVGYKFRFFGEDARTAAKELGIVCIPGKMRYDEHPSEAHIDRFASASIPVHRLHVHTKRLVAAGHKVGVVRQLETAALKAAGDNRNAPFVRKLTNLYTKGTYIDDVEGLEGTSAPNGPPTNGYLLCLTENRTKGWGTDEKVHVGILAVQPATGDIIYDDFEDGFLRSEIETRLLHLAPCEFFIVGELSKATDKLVRHLSSSKTNVFGDKIRLERVERPKTMAAQAYSHISDFYASRMKTDEADSLALTLFEKVLKLSENVTICLSAMITHMSDFGLEHVFNLTKYFQSFSARSHMLLNGTTLGSLEIYQNQTDQSEKGSLFWTLDRTQTRFGQRLLRKWVGRPLLERKRLEERIAAVEELKGGERTIKVDRIKHLLSKTKSDLEKSLIRIYYGKCIRPELLTVLQTMQMIATQFAEVDNLNPSSAGFQSPILNEAIASLPVISPDVIGYLDKINAQAAKEDDKYNFFRDEEETDDITAHKLGIVSVEHDLDTHRAVAAEKVKKKKVDYVTVAGIEYLIEVDNASQLKNVPASWMKISGTKKVSRFHTPEVVSLIRQRDQHKEALAAACDVAFSNLLAEISTKYQTFRDCVQALAKLDCLLSLATIANQPGYVKPEYTDATCIIVEQGRHPMVEQLLLDTYVPNNIDLASDATKALLVTGPNMGGKSSYVRQVALIAIMAQIGSYVPAKSAKLGLLDAVFTRMGAFDNMLAGESTFMVELSETADILKQASPRSLVILDELGRGTSTHDGVAIAQAVLDYVVRDLGCLTLFITHYQQLSALAKGFEGELENRHMRFTESGDEVTFLYEIGEGVAHRSYGLNVARLANLPSQVLDIASVKSKKLENEVKEKQVGRLSQSLSRLLSSSEAPDLDTLVEGIEML